MGTANTKAANVATVPQENYPDIWPGAFKIYRYSREIIRRNLSLLISIWLLYIAIDALLTIASRSHYSLLGSLINFVFGTVFTVMMAQAVLAGLYGRQTSFSEIFGGDLPSLSMKLFVLEVLTGVSVLVSLLLFIIPAFFVIPRLILAPYFLIDKNMGPTEAFAASWHATKDNAVKAWGIIGVTLLIALLMITLIGIPVAIYLIFMYSAAPAVLYAHLLPHKRAPARNLPKQG